MFLEWRLSKNLIAMNKILAIIGGGVMASYFGAACRRIGYESHYFSLSDGKIGEDEADVFHEIDIFDKEGIVRICKEIGVDGVVATTELTIPIAAYVADRLSLPGNPPKVADVITDKYRNRECIKDLTTLLSPAYVEADCVDDIVNSGLSYPIIIKPVNLGGKRGLSVAENRHELERAFEYAVDSFRPGANVVVIAEEFIDRGLECSVESVSCGGKHTVVQITHKVSSGYPHCVELSHHQPAPLKTDMWNKVVKAVCDGLTAIGLINGCCHTEIKIVEDRVYLIEFNARPGGDHISYPMVQLSTGYDFIAALAKAATGELKSIDVKSFRHHYSGMYYVVGQTSYLKPIFDCCQNMPWCWEKHFVSNRLVDLTHNDMENTNYFIYHSENGNPVEALLSDNQGCLKPGTECVDVQ